MVARSGFAALKPWRSKDKTSPVELQATATVRPPSGKEKSRTGDTATARPPSGKEKSRAGESKRTTKVERKNHSKPPRSPESKQPVDEKHESAAVGTTHERRDSHSSSVTFSSKVSVIYDTVLEEVQALAVKAGEYAKDKKYDFALSTYRQLKKKISRTLDGGVEMPPSEAEALCYINANSSFLMGMIYEDKRNDIVAAGSLFQAALDQYRAIRITIGNQSSQKLSPSAWKLDSSKGSRKSGGANDKDKKAPSHQKLEISLKIAMVSIRLVENFTKQKRWELAQDHAEDAINAIKLCEVTTDFRLARRYEAKFLSLKTRLSRHSLKIQRKLREMGCGDECSIETFYSKDTLGDEVFISSGASIVSRVAPASIVSKVAPCGSMYEI
jgi:tetratricopeptide (TPR) repeat protein